jgi:predicted Kef-type K+ transport protein
MSKQSLAVALAGLGVIIIIFGLGYAYYIQSLKQISSAPLPNQLVALPLSERIDGRSALTELSWMHNQGFSLSKGAVGTYGVENEIIKQAFKSNLRGWY